MPDVNRHLSALILLFILCGFFFLISNSSIVEASAQTIYIRANGSVDPSTAPISTVDNVTYTFNGNISDSIVVEKNDIVVDGAGYTIQGTGSGNGIAMFGRNNVTIKNATIKTFYFGILLMGSSNSSVFGNKITSNNHGVKVDNSLNNSISRNDVNTNDGNGIDLYESADNSICENNVTANAWVGIKLEGSSSNHNEIVGNYVTANGQIGIWLTISSHNNAIVGNRITNHISHAGIWLNSSDNNIFGNDMANNVNCLVLTFNFSSNNIIYHNNFVNNTIQVIDVGASAGNFSVNVWDNGFEGNYWNNYAGPDSDHDGIGNIPQPIDANNADHYPLMGMFHSFYTSLGYEAEVVSDSAIDDFEYFAANNTIKMYVTNMTANQTSGFIRACIPHELMNVTNVLVIVDDGLTSLLYHNYTLYDNGTHRWIYFNYEQSKHRIDIIPELPSYLIMILFMTTTLPAVVIRRRKPYCSRPRT